MPPFSLRCSEKMWLALERFYLECKPKLNKAQAIQFLLVRYLQNPHFYSSLNTKELREPLTRAANIVIEKGTQEEFRALAGSNSVSFSEMVRVAIYQELMLNEQ